MTYKELLTIEHPENVKEYYAGGCYSCPSTYGYKDLTDCKNVAFLEREEMIAQCTRCWNREVEE